MCRGDTLCNHRSRNSPSRGLATTCGAQIAQDSSRAYFLTWLVQMNPKAVWPFAKQTFSEWIDDNAPMHAAALSFYTAFSIAPLLIIAIAVAGVVFGQDAVRGRVCYSAQILFLGAEFTQVVSKLQTHGTRRDEVSKQQLGDRANATAWRSHGGQHPNTEQAS